MQATPSQPDYSSDNGFLQNLFSNLNNKLQKPVFWIVILVFVLTIGIGYGLGKRFVLRSGYPSDTKTITSAKDTARVITILEVSDLSEEKPELLSIWFIHLLPGDKPRLGFTPVASITTQEDTNYKLLAEFTLDDAKIPSSKFLQTLNQMKVRSSGFVMLDQVAVAAFVNWFSGKDSKEPINIENHSMTEYGQVLRSMCNSFPQIAANGIPEFQWTKFTPGHLITSLQFDQVMANMNFLTDSLSPQCEMVPLP